MNKDYDKIIDEIEINKIHARNAGRIAAGIAFTACVLAILMNQSVFTTVDFWISVVFAGLIYFIIYAAGYLILNLFGSKKPPNKPDVEQAEISVESKAKLQYHLPAGLRLADWTAVTDAIENEEIGFTATGESKSVSLRDLDGIGISRYEGKPTKARLMYGFMQKVGILDGDGRLTGSPFPPAGSVKEVPPGGGVQSATTQHHPAATGVGGYRG